MDLFFRFIAFFKGLFVKEKEVFLFNSIDCENVVIKKNYTVKIRTVVNSLDNEIVHRYYEVVGLSNRKVVKSSWAKDERRNINIICEYIRDVIELDANIKIDPSKLYKAIQICYSGQILVGDISIKFEPS